jgi:hypothetical protein
MQHNHHLDQQQTYEQYHDLEALNVLMADKHIVGVTLLLKKIHLYTF